MFVGLFRFTGGEAARDGNLVEETLGYYNSNSAIMINVMP